MSPQNEDRKYIRKVARFDSDGREIEWTNTSGKQVQLQEHFKVKDRNMLNKIIEGDPLSFTNVRHPFERLVSGYLDKAHKGEGNTFELFVGKVLRQWSQAHASKDTVNYAAINMHWRPYHTHCSFCNVPYKVISKTETFDEDKRRILGMLGVEEDEGGVRKNVHGGDNITDQTREYFKNITQQVKTDLLELYKYEFAMFHYDTDEY